MICHDDANWMVQILLLTHLSCAATLFLIKFMSKFKELIRRIYFNPLGLTLPSALHSPHTSVMKVTSVSPSLSIVIHGIQ